MPVVNGQMVSTLGFIQNIGPMEWIIILVVMLLLFGRRLPEVGKSLGKGIVEFKKGIKGVEDDVEGQSSARPPQQQAYTQQLPPGQTQNQQAPWPQQAPYAQQPSPYGQQAPAQSPPGTYPAQQPYPPQYPNPGYPMGGPGMPAPNAPQ